MLADRSILYSFLILVRKVFPKFGTHNLAHIQHKHSKAEDETKNISITKPNMKTKKDNNNNNNNNNNNTNNNNNNNNPFRECWPIGIFFIEDVGV